jgi:chromosome segregation ATPase
MRIPENRVQEVQDLIGGGGVESVTESRDETVTESFESATESKLLDELKAKLEEARKEIKFMAAENSRLSQQLISANENAKAAEDLASKMEAQAADKGGKLERVQAELEALKGTISNQPPALLDDLIALKVRWGALLQPHQDATGQVKQPRWAKCWEMWREFAKALQPIKDKNIGLATLEKHRKAILEMAQELPENERKEVEQMVDKLEHASRLISRS